MHVIRKYIREILLLEDHGTKKSSEDLLVEPDTTEEEPQEEVNAISTGGASMQSAGTIAGVSTPLGTGPSYPSKRKAKKKKKTKSGSTDWYKLGTK